MKTTATLKIKVEDFSVSRVIGVDVKTARDARTELEDKAREALGELCTVVYDEMLRLQAPPADPHQSALPSAGGAPVLGKHGKKTS